MFSGDSDNDEDDEDMEVEDVKQTDEAARARAVAEAIGKPPKKADSGNITDDMTDALKELNMDNYDDEDDGNNIVISIAVNCFCMN